jgi:hypothetical protein
MEEEDDCQQQRFCKHRLVQQRRILPRMWAKFGVSTERLMHGKEVVQDTAG